MMWTVPPEWLGETCFILGCGPSLNLVNTAKLYDWGRVIAINDAFLRAPYADILYFCDRKWWQQNQATVWEQFRGHRIVTLTEEYSKVHTLRNAGPLGLETDPGAVCHGENSVYQCINLAYHLGATRIVLMGVDMQVKNGQMHWRQRQDKQTPADFQKTLQQVMLPTFASLVQPLEAADVEVINSTPDSALKVWPYRSLEQVLEEERTCSWAT